MTRSNKGPVRAKGQHLSATEAMQGKSFIYSAHVELAIFLLKAKIMTYKLCLQPQALFLLADAKSRCGLTVQSVGNNSVSGNVVKAETEKQRPQTKFYKPEQNFNSKGKDATQENPLFTIIVQSLNVRNTHLSFVTVRHSLSSLNLYKSKYCIINSFRPLRHI